MHRFGENKTEVVGQAIRKPLTPVGGGIGMTERSFHPNLSVAYLDRADRYVVRPQVEGAAAFEIEAGVVPMTGQDSVVEAAALEWETHVRAAIVESKDAPAVVDDKDRTMATVHNEAPLHLQLIKAARECEILVRRIHEYRSFESCGLRAKYDGLCRLYCLVGYRVSRPQRLFLAQSGQSRSSWGKAV